MKKRCALFLALLMTNSVSYANWFQDIINVINKQSGITHGLMNEELSVQRDMLGTQNDIQKLMNQLNGHVTGHSGYGNYQFHDYQSYGQGAKDWSSVINMADRGQGDGALGQMIGSIGQDFPHDVGSYNRGVSNGMAQRYYARKAQTTVAARAASELDYNKIHDQIAYQHMLMQQIEKTKDLKAAVDLNNRIQIEGNLINLAILRKSTLVNQQQAVNEEASVMNALSHAKFLTK